MIKLCYKSTDPMHWSPKDILEKLLKEVDSIKRLVVVIDNDEEIRVLTAQTSDPFTLLHMGAELTMRRLLDGSDD